MAVDDTVLAQLVHAATTDAVADEVTQPLTAGRAWTSARVAWLRDFHRVRRAGLAGPAGEATWAVVLDERVVGTPVRPHFSRPQCGALAHSCGHGRSSDAATTGATGQPNARLQDAMLITTVANAGALALLRRLGCTLTPAHNGHDVSALRLLGPEVSGDECRSRSCTDHA